MTLIEEVAELVRLRNNGPSCEDIAERILRLVAERQLEKMWGDAWFDVKGYWRKEGIEP